MAGVYEAPCVFFCQNNQYAISVPVREQTASPTIAQKAWPTAFPACGWTATTSWRCMPSCARRSSARGAATGRPWSRPIPTASAPTPRRTTRPNTATTPRVEGWRPRDPLLRVQKYLQARGAWSEDWEHELLEACTGKVEQAMNDAEAVPPPPPQDMFRYMFAEPPALLREQEAGLLAALQLQQKG